MEATVGDRLHVHGNAVGQPDKIGEIVENKVRVQHGLNAGDKVIAHGSFIAKSELLKATIGD